MHMQPLTSYMAVLVKYFITVIPEILMEKIARKNSLTFHDFLPDSKILPQVMKYLDISPTLKHEFPIPLVPFTFGTFTLGQ